MPTCDDWVGSSKQWVNAVNGATKKRKSTPFFWEVGVSKAARDTPRLHGSTSVEAAWLEMIGLRDFDAGASGARSKICSLSAFNPRPMSHDWVSGRVASLRKSSGYTWYHEATDAYVGDSSQKHSQSESSTRALKRRVSKVEAVCATSSEVRLNMFPIGIAQYVPQQAVQAQEGVQP